MAVLYIVLECMSTGKTRFFGLPAFLVFPGDHRRFLDPMTFAGDGDDLGVVQEPANDGPGMHGNFARVCIFADITEGFSLWLRPAGASNTGRALILFLFK